LVLLEPVGALEGEAAALLEAGALDFVVVDELEPVGRAGEEMWPLLRDGPAAADPVEAEAGVVVVAVGEVEVDVVVEAERL
jgi:hypothetical protein